MVSVAGASGADVLHECAEEEQLSKTYTQDEYREALDNMDGDMRQYTNCEAVIINAQREAARRGGAAKSPPGSSSSQRQLNSPVSRAETAAILASATPQQRQALARAASQPPPPVGLEGVGPLDVAGASSLMDISRRDLPLPLQILVALLAAAGVTAAVTSAKRLPYRSAAHR